MKKILFSVLTLSLLFTGCKSEKESKVEPTSMELGVKGEHKEMFGFALMKSLNQSPELRKLIKDEALKMFNKDYEVLVHAIKNKRLEGGVTFEELVNSNAHENFSLYGLLEMEPTLTILVPELPENSFSAEIWNSEWEIPAVAIRTNQFNEIPLITPEGKMELMPSDVTPGFPVVVIKNNERLVSTIEDPNVNELKTRTVFEEGGVIIKFWDNAFDNTIKNNNGLKRLTTNLDPVIVSAYNIYQQQNPGLNGWQRDYIYYGIEPSNTSGAFIYDFQEHIKTFSMIGNAKDAYNKIADQTGDPRYKQDHRIHTSQWSGGFYEFKVKTLINAKNGVGTELINGFTVAPRDLFYLEYEKYTKGKSFWKKTYFRVKSVSNKTVNINLPIINWNLDEYASSIKVEFEEVDLTVTTKITDTRTVKFATNFGINNGEKKKIGIKFGASLETTSTRSTQKTFTQGNDVLGAAIVNFADKVVISRILGVWGTRDYSTGYCKFNLEPVRVQ